MAATFLAATSNGLFGQMLYVGNNGDDTISAYVIDQQSGLLTELLPRVPSTGAPSSVAVHPSGKFVYVTNFGNANFGANGPSLAVFSINPNTGALTPLSSVPLVPGSSPQAVAIDPSGKFALVASQAANSISVFAIDTATGALSPVAGSPFTTPQGPSSVVVHPNGKFAYASAAGAGQIAAFGIDANGALTPVAGSPFAARNNLFWMTMDPAGKFLFAVERQDNAVLVYSVNATTGALTQVGAPFPAQGAVSGVTVDPAGKFLYVSNFASGSVTGFSIGATGALTPVPRGSVPAILGAFAAILDPSGKFLYVPGQQANALVAYTVDSNTGALTPFAQQFIPTGSAPERGATVLLSPPVIPPIIVDGVSNYFSTAPAGMPNAGIAQGSKFSISGKNIGPAIAARPQSAPLQAELGGVSIQIQSGDVITPAIMTFASNNFVTAVVPSTTPLGDATVTLTYNGRTTTPVPVTIVPVTVGIRTLNGNGNGPAKAWNATPDTGADTDLSTLPPNVLNQTAKPGQMMVVQATGLGPVAADETQDFSQTINVPADVIVGNKLSTAALEVRVATGVDYILFKLPDDAPEGCYVPLAIRAGGVTSNVASVSISATGATCSDPAGLSASDIDAAQRAGGLTIGAVALQHDDLGPLGVQDRADASFARFDLNSLFSAFAQAGGPGIRQAFGTPPLGTCTVSPGTPADPNDPFNLPSDQVSGQFLTAGNLNLNGPQGAGQLTAPDYRFRPNGGFITPGGYTVDNGTGVPPVGPFKASLTVPPPLTWTTQSDLTSLDRTQDLTVTWRGGVADKEFAIIVGLSSNQQATGGFLCAEKVSAGQFTVPAWVLSSLPASGVVAFGDQSIPGGVVGVGTAPLTSAGRFTANGLNFGLFTYEQASVSFTSYQ